MTTIQTTSYCDAAGQPVLAARPVELYRVYDSADVLLYVGISNNCQERLRKHSHRDGQPWWSEVAYCTLEQFPFEAVALEAERAAIKTERPRYNKRSAVRV